MTTLIIAALCIATLAFAIGLIAIAAAHWRDRGDYDGETFDKPKQQHPIWRDEP